MGEVRVVTVFADGPGGGNPAPIGLDAAELTAGDMQALAREHGHESAFVVDASGTGCDLALRFWVPAHEMEMCGHATVGAVWLLAQCAKLPRAGTVSVHTASGVVQARVADDLSVRISQPVGRSKPVHDADVVRDLIDVLGLGRDDLADLPVRNATTSRTKTIVPVRDVARLDDIVPDFARVEELCTRLGSTGLYPYAISGDRQIDARQFPRSSGYPEDPATGIAAAALVFGLLADGVIAADVQTMSIRQGRAMSRPSLITVDLDVVDGRVSGCWLGGTVTEAQ